MWGRTLGPPKIENELNCGLVGLWAGGLWEVNCGNRGGWGGLVGCVGALWFEEYSLLKFRSSHPKHHYPKRVGPDTYFDFVLRLVGLQTLGRGTRVLGERGEVLGGRGGDAEGEPHAHG